jgi:hypothetical protein
MIRLFDIFLGRSTVMRALDDALRAAGLHPLLVPDPVKLTVIQLTKKLAAAQAQEAAFPDAGHADQRLEAAMDEGDTLDAKLILLAFHAGLITPEIADRIEIDEAETDQA